MADGYVIETGALVAFAIGGGLRVIAPLVLDVLARGLGRPAAHAARSSGKARRAFFELLRKHDIDAAQFRRAR